ncbi:RNA polymerase sigma factor [Kurthia populi]|uniref:RNA polymerase sigma factor n=1 Tax=Kurthia populi TaxID=1562132 RepID=A0ABW5Y0V1_9BACL|nr:sigma-70 family RNA polymerase sigma factor [Kurthia sp. Dielmo]HIX42156.1 sigma-70 family RNA polymerase sigma factor [Candidatus Kurthia intestinigallinarum]
MNKIEEYYVDLQPQVEAFFYAKTANRMLAQDLCQDTFYEACKSVDTFSGASTLKTWIFSIANNLLKKYYRKNHYEIDLLGMLSALPEQEVPSTEHLIEVQEDMKHFLYVLSKLKKDEQELVLLRTYGELSFAEVGEMLGKSENYARVTFHRLKRKLQQEMEDM